MIITDLLIGHGRRVSCFEVAEEHKTVFPKFVTGRRPGQAKLLSYDVTDKPGEALAGPKIWNFKGDLSRVNRS